MDNNKCYEAWSQLEDDLVIRRYALDHNIPIDDEVDEILALTPSFDNKKILELGAGVGRFTRCFCKTASSITALDFSDKFIKENKIRCVANTKINYICTDVLDWRFPQNEYDLVFVSWLLMYIDDINLPRLLESIRASLNEGGEVFIRESCNHSVIVNDSKSKKEQSIIDVTNYRSKEHYSSLFTQAGLSLKKSGNIQFHKKWFDNNNQNFWILCK